MSDEPRPPEPVDQAGPAEPAEPAAQRWPWWHRLRPMTRRTIRASLAVLISALAAATFGVTTSSYTGSLGPHAAQYATTLNGEITVDMGPLGALIVDSPLPLNLGVHVLVKEIPDELSAPDANPVAGLTADLTSYSQFLANPDAAVREATHGLVRDAVGRSVLALSILLVIVALGRLAAHGVLREAAKSAWRQRGVPALSMTLAAVLLALPLIESTRTSGGVGRTSAILQDTPLASARITGRLATIVDQYGGYVVDAINDNTSFYAAVEANLRAAFAEDPQPVAPTGPLETTAGAATDTPPATPTTAPATDAPSAGAPSAGAPATDAGSADADAPPADDSSGAEPVTMLLVSDLHCNVGMAAVIGAATEASGADLVLNAGDTVMAGTSVESFCVNAFADGIPDGVPVVVSDGNHDSVLTSEQERAAGWLVLAGEPIEVAGIRFLGDTDPTLTSLGVPTRPERDETVIEMGERLAQQACELEDAGEAIDIMLIHSPYAGRETIDAGCVPLEISGHFHRQVGPWQRGFGIQYVNASTAGAGSGAPTIGPLRNTAAMTVIRWDPDTRLPLDFRVIEIAPDTSVALTDWYPFPARPTTFVDATEPEPVP